MDRIAGLRDYIHSKPYREALELPKEVQEDYVLLAQGEYNINYRFTHPVTKQELVLRVNCGSQMHLEDQITYEAEALKLLEKSGRTPRVLYVDGSCTKLDHGILVMEYLPGHALRYETELYRAAPILADIHSLAVPKSHHLIAPEEPFAAILEECEAMVSTYMESDLGKEETKIRLRKLLDAGWARLSSKIENASVEDNSRSENDVSEREDRRETEQGNRIPYRCIINTELNSTNFLINEPGARDYLIDWEKPLYGEPAQDLGHFLAPTTTFWKTDILLTLEEIDAFITEYIRQVKGRFPTDKIRERTMEFISYTCLRGVTWCAMAWVEYQDPRKLIANESTKRKLDSYLSDRFLTRIEEIWGI